MQVKFKYDRKIDKTMYKAGVHELPDDLKNHWYFLALLSNHDVVIVGPNSNGEPPVKTFPGLAEQKARSQKITPSGPKNVAPSAAPIGETPPLETDQNSNPPVKAADQSLPNSEQPKGDAPKTVLNQKPRSTAPITQSK